MPYKILIVDDSEEDRKRMSAIFSTSDFSIIEAKDGAEGLSLALDKIPDLLITGIVMPKMTGFEMIEQLKKNVATANIPIMILSHMGRKEDQLKAQTMGIKDFLTSGFVSPKEMRSLALLRIEGEKGGMKYRVEVNETSMDVSKLTKDFEFQPYLKCEFHPEEKKVLELIADTEKPGEFHAKFICPQGK